MMTSFSGFVPTSVDKNIESLINFKHLLNQTILTLNFSSRPSILQIVCFNRKKLFGAQVRKVES